MDRRDPSETRLTPLRERSLIEDARRGSREGARQLIGAHQDRLYAFVWRIVRNHHDAEEICQDAFLRAFQSLRSFDFRYRFSTWLFTIGYRLCLNALRRKKAYTGDVDLDAVGPGPGGEEHPSVADQVVNSDEARRLKKIIWGSVDELTPPQRATVLLFYREQLSCEEIGDILEMPAATVKSHLHRARSKLKAMLSAELVDDWAKVRLAQGGAA